MSEPLAAPPATAQPGPRTRSRAFTRQVWLDRLARFPLSGLTPAQFCALEAVSLPSFYSWKRRLAAEALGPDTDTGPDTHSTPRLLPVRLTQPSAALELVLPSGAVLRVAAGADETALRGLLRLLGVPPC
jgi:transposase